MAAFVGKRCEVLFAGDDGEPWFAGTITSHSPGSGKHEVTFDDGDTRQVHLQEHLDESILRFLDEAIVPPSNAVAAQPRLGGLDLLGNRVELWFADAHPKPAYYSGIIDDYDPDPTSTTHAAHCIRFDDGDKRWVRLEEEAAEGHLRWEGDGAWPTGVPSAGRSARRRMPAAPLSSPGPHPGTTAAKQRSATKATTSLATKRGRASVTTKGRSDLTGMLMSTPRVNADADEEEEEKEGEKMDADEEEEEKEAEKMDADEPRADARPSLRSLSGRPSRAAARSSPRHSSLSSPRSSCFSSSSA